MMGILQNIFVPHLSNEGCKFLCQFLFFPYSFSSSSFLVLLLLRSCEFSVTCGTPTAILRVQCGAPAPAILWVQCGVLDPNYDLVSSVLCAGPQLRSCEFSVACPTPTAIMRVQYGRAGPQLWWKRLVAVAERLCQRSTCRMFQQK